MTAALEAIKRVIVTQKIEHNTDLSDDMKETMKIALKHFSLRRLEAIERALIEYRKDRNAIRLYDTFIRHLEASKDD